MKKIFVLIATAALMPAAVLWAAEEEQVKSPDGRITARVLLQETVRYSVLLNDRHLIKDAPISLTLSGERRPGIEPKLKSADRREVKQTLRPVVPIKNAEIEDHCNEMVLRFEGDYGLVFRIYNDAVAYRWITDLPDKIRVIDEQVVFAFDADGTVYFPEEESFLSHSERLYTKCNLSAVTPEQFCSLPVLIDLPDGPKLVITEADLSDYPGLYLSGSAAKILTGRFPAVAIKEEQKNDRTVAVIERADYIAETTGSRAFPWRVVAIAENDRDLLVNEIVYKLAPEQRLEDPSWIKPGKVAWDWWNANNLCGVDFRAGINTDTYKYYIDFAARHGIEYIILDEGWYPLGDLLSVSPDIDMEELFAYAREKGVGIILWVVWKTLDDQLHEALDKFQQWGAAGVKVDFMQRDDQWMVNYYEKIARETAKRRLLVDFHGSYTPKGLRRAWPNVLTREGVKGLENCKWSDQITPEHDVTIPFIRMLAGPMDYTPGAMDNAQTKNFKPRWSRPMSQGTRCHQMAMYVIYESPLQMLADSPSNYLREPACTKFISQVPVVWDRTLALDAKVGDYLLMARRSGKTWYVGAMTDENARELTVDLAFLKEGAYTAEIFQDGINADRCGCDYKHETRRVEPDDQLKIELAPGGGWAACLSRL